MSALDTPDMFIVPYAGHVVMIEAGEIVRNVINDFLIKLDPHLSHAWQLSYTAGERWRLKNEQKVALLNRRLMIKWTNIKCVSELVGISPLRAMKVTNRYYLITADSPSD